MTDEQQDPGTSGGQDTPSIDPSEILGTGLRNLQEEETPEPEPVTTPEPEPEPSGGETKTAELIRALRETMAQRQEPIQPEPEPPKEPKEEEEILVPSFVLTDGLSAAKNPDLHAAIGDSGISAINAAIRAGSTASYEVGYRAAMKAHKAAMKESLSGIEQKIPTSVLGLVEQRLALQEEKNRFYGANADLFEGSTPEIARTRENIFQNLVNATITDHPEWRGAAGFGKALVEAGKLFREVFNVGAAQSTQTGKTTTRTTPASFAGAQVPRATTPEPTLTAQEKEDLAFASFLGGPDGMGLT